MISNVKKGMFLASVPALYLVCVRSKWRVT